MEFEFLGFQKKIFKVLKPSTFFILSLALSLVLSGCFENKIIDKVAYDISPNAETAKVSLVFDERIHSDIGGTFPVDNHGAVEISPWSSSRPFSIGFRLNFDTFTENEYVNLKSVSRLPTSDPFPPAITTALKEVSVKNPVNDLFNLYVYVDVANHQWLGLIVVLNFLDLDNFPFSISIGQDFLPDTNGNIQATALVFGPTVNASGQMLTPGGFGVFANVASLSGYSHPKLKPGSMNYNAFSALKVADETPFVVQPVMKRVKGESQAVDSFRVLRKNSKKYQRDPALLNELQEKIQERLIEAFNAKNN